MGKTNDMQAARAAYDAMGKKSDLWKPDPGVYFIRVLEPMGEMATFFSGYPLHWGFGEPVICPRRAFGGQCPICVYGNSLSKDEGKKFWANWSAYLNILLVDEDGDPIPDEEGEAQVKAWRVGRETLGKIFNAIERISPSVDKLVDITNAETGVDLRVKRTGKDTDTDWDVDCVRRGASSIEEYREAWEPKAIDLTGYHVVKSPDELAALLTGSQDAYTQAKLAQPSAKKQLKAPGAKAPHATEAAVVQDDGEEIPVPQEEAPGVPVSSGKAKLEALMKKKGDK